MSTSAVRIVEAVLSAAVWLMKLNRLTSAGSHDDETRGSAIKAIYGSGSPYSLGIWTGLMTTQ